MYGTISTGRLKKDFLREMMALGKEWDARERKRAVGYINSEILWSDAGDGRFMMIVHFTTKEAYIENARSPEQDAFYRRLRACMEEDPTWFDGTFAAWDSPYAKPPNLA